MPTLSDDALRDAVRGVLMRLAPEQRDAAALRARELLAEQRPELYGVTVQSGRTSGA